MLPNQLKDKAKTLNVRKSGVHSRLQRLIVNGFFDTPKSTEDIVVEVRNSSGKKLNPSVIHPYMKKFMGEEIIRSLKKNQGNGNLWLLASDVPSDKQVQPPVFSGSKTKILFLAANPLGTNQLSLDQESREIEEKIQASSHRDSLELITKWAVRPTDLLQHFNQHRARVIHFSGHGSEAEEIVFADAEGKPKRVGKDALRLLFKTLKDDIRVVVLNACYSRPQAEAITEFIDCAIGMNKAIGDPAAILFSAAFYQAIGFGRSVKSAFESGRTAIMLEGVPEDQTPELLVRRGVKADKIFLV